LVSSGFGKQTNPSDFLAKRIRFIEKNRVKSHEINT